MSKADKIAEARFFLQEMKATDERDRFRFMLSGFLSAARSVLQYAHRDVEGNLPGRQWYDDTMSASLVLSFFKDERDFNIHRRPVAVLSQTTVEARIQINVRASVAITVRHADGSVEELGSTEPPTPAPVPPPTPAKVTTRYFFTDWSPQDVVEVAEMYVDELDAVVTDGLARGFIQA